MIRVGGDFRILRASPNYKIILSSTPSMNLRIRITNTYGVMTQEKW